ncbi:ATP-binding protein [Clostridium sp. ZS2-4]|uniref:ATP-binding protein n=1 Tax=Clostridium sp. ZS2-4 TaxID=2987703 RepID=UPI00227AD913|nr:SbcC/MukB-like Walker B domain-containing protein [Clostridium sp. ZS2-4]MCY6354991.1 AAA family ATPase [Clostridium sp. ZS2-4]
MKKLTGMRLINWHAFVDETMNIKNSVLISGENGAGKSTILDAIQFVLTCNKNNFNKAANENSKRNLTGYVRYKTGREGSEYSRTGDITSHLALEFYEENRKNYFIIGAVIDSSSETSEKVMFYRIEKHRIKDINYIVDGVPLDISNFKTLYRSKSIQAYTNYGEARKDFLNKLGRIGEKFNALLPKALAFKPITDVKDFVYQYILEEKELSIDNLRENIRTYKECQNLVDDVRKRIEKLENIKESYEEYERAASNVNLHSFIIDIVDREILREEIRILEEKIKSDENNKILSEKKQKELNDLIRQNEDKRNNIQITLNTNEEFIALADINKKISEKENNLEKLSNSKKTFINKLKEEERRLKRLKDLGIEKIDINIFLDFTRNINVELENFINIAKSLSEKLDKRKEEDLKSSTKYELDIEKQREELKEVEVSIKELEKRNLQYPKNVITLKEEIITNFKTLGINDEPKILCEVLEVTDPKWKNAVEGYLNTQRFYLIVEGKNFDKALDVYDRLVKKKGIHSVGLINTLKLGKYDDVDTNSLAAVVTSKSRDGKRFINMILGRVIREENLNKLKEHKTAITPDCMVYQNHVARAIDKEIYKRPYIGEEAYKIQLEEFKEKREVLKEKIDDLLEKKKDLDNVIKIIRDTKLERISEDVYVVREEEIERTALASVKKEKEELTKNSTFMELNFKLQEVSKELEGLKEKYNSIAINIGALKNRIETHRENRKYKLGNLERKEEELKEKCLKNVGVFEEGEKRVEVERKRKTLETIKSNFTTSKNNNETRKQNRLEELKNLQGDYNREYEFGAALGEDGVGSFLDELEKLRKSTIIEYEDNVKKAKERAELEFREHFISKINENITIAKKEFRDLNRALQGVKFGNEEYEFKIEKSKDAKVNKYYDMIMDERNIGEGYTLFTQDYEDKYKEVLEELFDKLTIDGESEDKELQRFTDYRTYMNYDIKIKHSNGEHSLFSKVCKEKSGGETQTPYYVAMAASFVQLYSMPTNSEPIGLILFDEAFDKMDESRIVAMMEFFNRLPLQLIIASPPQKIDTITPFVNTTLLAIKGEDYSLIEGYNNEKVQGRDTE